jgi:hypothetical protein
VCGGGRLGQVVDLTAVRNIVVNWFKKLPGIERTPPGREWALWKRLPAILACGTAVPLLAGALLWWAAPGQPSAAEERALWLTTYQLIGLLTVHWSLVATLAIGCAIVIVMKGPAYVADGYPPPGRDTHG